jgi:transcriptional regulator with XRE-family HTH domain
VTDGFGELVHRYRVAASLTQEELAERSGLSVRAISNMERGRTSQPRRSSVSLLCRVLRLAGPIRDEWGPESPVSRGEADSLMPDSDDAQPGLPGTAGPRDRQVVPRQLPAAATHFAGRAAELKALDGPLDRAGCDARGSVVICAISGTAGVGKTALAVHWAHSAAQRFPDGQLYVNLRGFDPSGTPVTPAEAIHGFLGALHVPAGRLPESLDAQAGLFRSLLAGRRMLIVLDNARDAAQIRPLLPGSDACCVIVTSRSQLTSLVAEQGAHPLTLDVLTEAEARELLSRRLGPERIAGESEAVDELIGRCARLPLALAIVAARAAVGPCHPLTALVEELRDTRSRLDALDAGDSATSARAMFSWSYQSLSGPAARMFRLLGVHPGPDISGPAAASLAGVRLDQAHEMLRELTRANLLGEGPARRFAFHGLLRAYAAERACAEESDAARRAALDRVLGHYRHCALAAAEPPSTPHEASATVLSRPAPARADVAAHKQARTWFEAACVAPIPS